MQGPEFLQTLVNQTLCYGIKSPDMDLYDFGFSNRVLDFDKDAKEAYTHFLHVVCRFKVIWRRGKRRIVIYDEDTPSEKFQTECSRLVGLNVRCALLSEKTTCGWILGTAGWYLPHLRMGKNHGDFLRRR